MNWLGSFFSAAKTKFLPDSPVKFFPSFCLITLQFNKSTHKRFKTCFRAIFSLAFYLRKSFEHQQIAIIDGVKVLWCASKRRRQKKTTMKRNHFPLWMHFMRLLAQIQWNRKFTMPFTLLFTHLKSNQKKKWKKRTELRAEAESVCENEREVEKNRTPD